MTSATPERLSDVLNSLETLRAANHAQIQAAPTSEATKASARGTVERSHEYAARLCPQIAAMFDTSNTSEARH